MRICGYAPPAVLVAVLLMISTMGAEAAQTIELTSTENHHVAGLNSSQPYVAGYHVDSVDLYTRECVRATAVTVSFPSTDPSYFPPGSWLGGGMFVQGQDTKLGYVDYAFYTMLVVDASGELFLDVGLHQTRESNPPLQMPSAELVYAYTWRVSGIDPATPVTLTAQWDSEGFVHYSISTSEANVTASSIDVASMPSAQSIIKTFYAGDATNGNPFPLGHYVHYFQFGVTSSEIIDDDHWSVGVKDPKLLRPDGWSFVDVAWSTQGDLSYIDADWMWGGAPYQGVSARYHENPLQNPYEVVFFYDGQTLPAGTVLWQEAYLEADSQIGFGAPPNSRGPFPYDRLIQALMTVVAVGVAVTYIGLRKKEKRSIEGVKQVGALPFPSQCQPSLLLVTHACLKL